MPWAPRQPHPVSVLWAYWSFAAAALAFPLQHWAARSVTATGGEHAVRRSLPAVAAAVLTLSPVVGLLAWLARDSLFHRGDAWFPVLVVLATVGSALTGLVQRHAPGTRAVRRGGAGPGAWRTSSAAW